MIDVDAHTVALVTAARLDSHIIEDNRRFDDLLASMRGIYKILWSASGGIALLLLTKFVDYALPHIK